MGKKKSEICPKGKNPENCTPEEIAECHPERKDAHPCEGKADKAKKKCCK